ncbi:methyl-accepting chemotaxis protein [Burkholderia sp. Bp9031]|uniref:methyl-accepting chemotaxis protein n=1 Tax=Burkholderia sp. Bp9031 TaxID=2184566 RepID=UPI0026D0DF45|nr:methyl-accepting chemotaxis protein [Burkholderia sp. Bp9031]
MLSQRIVLHVLLASRGDDTALDVAKQSVAMFANAHDDLVDGNEQLPGAFSEALRQLYFGTRRADEHVRRFITHTSKMLARLESDSTATDEQVDALVRQATPLLELLQQITLAYQNEMRGIESEALKRQVSIAEQLGSISMQANIVALNARIAAARAGSYGREFAVITTVLADIIKEMDQLMFRVIGTRGTADASLGRSAMAYGRRASVGSARR